LLNIAEVFSRRICHPEEILLQKGVVFQKWFIQDNFDEEQLK
jgi:hypothetical protein